MTNDEYHRLNLLRLSVLAVKRQIVDQLDAIDAEISQLIPPDHQAQARQKPSLDTMRQTIHEIIDKKYNSHSQYKMSN